MTPWPVLFWIQSFPPYLWSSRHGNAEPIHAIAGLAEVATYILTGLGVILILTSWSRDPRTWPREELRFYVWGIYATTNALILLAYISQHSLVGI